jgi:F0F1-type ATP synthase assembly protein I
VSRNVLAATAVQALRILAWQMGWIVAVAALAAIVWDVRSALSLLTGGAIGSVWTIYMALTLFRHSLTQGVRMSVMSFVMAWVIKVALTVSLLVIAFRSGLFAPLGLLSGLFAALLAYWVWLTFRVKHAGGADGK